MNSSLPCKIVRGAPWIACLSVLFCMMIQTLTATEVTELRRFAAEEAKQGVAVDADHFYAIDNRTIGKYRKDTGERVAVWKGEKGGPIIHLNQGFVCEDRLYCAHSNFPKKPDESSVEIWDTKTLQPVDKHVFENPPGSLTWILPEGENWLACFAHYKKTSDPSKTVVVRYDKDWKELARWHFPAKMIAGFRGMSSSGGGIGPDGQLYVSGHDAAELYRVSLPEGGGELRLEETVPVSAEGQAFDWDTSSAGMLYSIQRKTKEVIVSRASGYAGG